MKNFDIFKESAKRSFNACVDELHEKDLLPVAQLIWHAESQGNRLHITGIGKPAHVANYAASLFSSTGTPAYFLHGTEAVHGSCGQLIPGDVVVCISNSGETAELKSTAIAIRNNGGKLVALTGNAQSWLAQFADIHLLVRVPEEGGPLNRAPRNSIEAETLVLQALSVILQDKKQLLPAEYVLRHPGGALGELRKGELEDS